MQLPNIPCPTAFLISLQHNICIHFFSIPEARAGIFESGWGVSEVYREEGRGVGDQTVRARSPLPVWIVGDFVGSW